MYKVLIDGSKLYKDVASGISNYLISVLEYFDLNDKKFDIQTKTILISDYPTRNVFYQKSHIPKSKFIVINKIQFLLRIMLGINIDTDLFHSPYMFLPPKQNGRINLLTVHDLINLEKPFSIKNYFRAYFLSLAIKRADYYICISNATKLKLQTHFKSIQENRIFTIYQGINTSYFSAPKSLPRVISNPYLLYVGQREGYKNFSSLINFMLKSTWGNRLQVVCVGGGPFSNEEIKKIKLLSLENKIVHAGFVNDDQLMGLYKNAVALTYTSLQEGFGLPILEAMALECPVICGNFSSMKEISNGRACFVENFSIQSLESAMLQVLKITKEELEEAKAYAQNFSWKNTAQNTISLYDKLLKENEIQLNLKSRSES